MPVFIQALPLSLKTFWRYLILLPFLAVGALLLSLLSLFPVLGLLVPGAISAGLLIMGLRCALAARGHGGELVFGRLVMVSLVFSLIGIAISLLTPALNTAMLWAFDKAGVPAEPVGVLIGVFGLSYYWAGVVLAMFTPSALILSALAIPLTAAAASTNDRGPDSGLMQGFGTGILGLCVPLIVGLFLGNIFSFFGEVQTMFALILTTLMALANGTELPWDWSISPRSLLGGTLAITWASSWFFATAVLYWERANEKEALKNTARAQANRVSSTDIRAMRQAREQQNLQAR